MKQVVEMFLNFLTLKVYDMNDILTVWCMTVIYIRRNIFPPDSAMLINCRISNE